MARNRFGGDAASWLFTTNSDRAVVIPRPGRTVTAWSGAPENLDRVQYGDLRAVDDTVTVLTTVPVIASGQVPEFDGPDDAGVTKLWISADEGATGVWITTTTISKAAATGSYTDLAGKPTIPTTPGQVGADAAGAATSAVSGHVAATDPHGDRVYADGQVSAERSRAQGVEANKADLVGGKVPSSQIPSVALEHGVITVANAAARYALVLHSTIELGQPVVQASTGQTFLLVDGATDPSQSGQWIEIPAIGKVQSVNGSQGAVVLAAGDVGAEPAIAAPSSAPTSKYLRGDKTWQDLAGDPALIAAQAFDPADVGFDVILLAGQSNMVSYGTGPVDTTYLDPPDPRVRQWPGSGAYFGLGRPVVAIDPLFHHEQQSATVGHAMEFARRYARGTKPNRRVLLVPCAHGATGFTTSSQSPAPTGYTTVTGGGWDSTGAQGGINLYEFAIAQANAAIASGANNRIAGILWHQGEADNALSTSAYAAKLDALIAGLRSRITGATATTPVLIGQMVPERIAANSNYANINTAHVEAPRRLTSVGFYYGPVGYARTDDFTPPLHYTNEGQRRLGISAYDALALARADVTGTAPVTPGAVSILQTSATAVALSWVRTAGRVTDYVVEYNTGSGWSALTRAQSIDAAATITGLAAGAALQVRVSAVNEQGTSSSSSVSSLTLLRTPNSPTGLTAGTATSTGQPLSWTASATDGTHSAAATYLVEYRLSPAGSWNTFGTVTGTAATVLGLTPQTAYDYRVTATNPGGSSAASSTVTATTAASSPLFTDVGIAGLRGYSLRKLNASAVKAVKVRRSSDSTTQDIGFATGTNDLDTTALLAFVGAGSGYIDTWYDQSGNGYDISQATAAAQPRVVNAGTLDTVNSKPTAVFSGAQNLTDATNGRGALALGAATLCTVVKAPVPGSGFPVLFSEGSTDATHAWYDIFVTGTSGNGGLTAHDDASASAANLGFGATVNLLNGVGTQFSYSDTAGAIAFYVNGGAAVTSSYTRAGHTFTPQRFTLGASFHHSATATAPYTGNLSEFVVWTSVLTTGQRQSAEANQKAFYGTP